ncbi:protein spaetzle-like [Ceratitis capitata]|uniref:protein spaetzle-like n=1 Tax=Ceratitis capitata TaxID=7213 RepID=UPI000618974E|nr:protein spaetzle-like [Ceratitis capitata]
MSCFQLKLWRRVFSLLLLLLLVTYTAARPIVDGMDIEMDADFGDLFEVGDGFVVYNTSHDIKAEEEVICTERVKGQTFCTEVANYLEAAQLNKFTKDDFEKFRPYFKDDFVQETPIANRMSDEIDESYYCESRTRLIYPKLAETVESKWLMVVQHQQYKQGIVVEQCANEDAPCKYDDLLPFGVKSRCRQHYVYRSLVVLVDGEMQERSMKLPSACKCALRDMRRS